MLSPLSFTSLEIINLSSFHKNLSLANEKDVFFLPFFFLAVPHNIWNYSCLTRDQTPASCHWKHQVLTLGGGGLVTKSYPALATLWTVAHQAPLSMGFPRQEYWSGLPFPSPGDLPDPGIKSTSPA